MSALYRVVQAYERAYPDPIAVAAREPLTVGEEDSEYPGWIWCTNCAGKSGWVPLDCVDRSAAQAIYDYSALELSAGEGEELAVESVKNGWAFATNSAGETGWIPIANLEEAE